MLIPLRNRNGHDLLCLFSLFLGPKLKVTQVESSTHQELLSLRQTCATSFTDFWKPESWSYVYHPSPKSIFLKNRKQSMILLPIRVRDLYILRCPKLFKEVKAVYFNLGNSSLGKVMSLHARVYEFESQNAF